MNDDWLVFIRMLIGVLIDRSKKHQMAGSVYVSDHEFAENEKLHKALLKAITS